VDIFRIKITGLVQGVGFRPFVYRIAGKFHIKGTVENRNDGVIIEMEGNKVLLNGFIKAIRSEAPPASAIENIEIENIIKKEGFNGFNIVKSTNASDEVTEISPDIAVCKDCLQDMKTQPHRLSYPFINCTNCGPRFSIIKDLPYDRDKTTMKPFAMCPVCKKEYTDITDRRFHAQPVACNNCGPVYTLYHKKDNLNGHDKILSMAAEMLNKGDILAIKGMGGYFLACNALDQKAVNRLRERKKRDAKPFAVMFKDMESLNKYTLVTPAEKKLITSWRRPIVLLRQTRRLCDAVNYKLDKLGAFLPYMPFHYQLFEASGLEALVMTSGNVSDEPIIIDDNEALEKLSPIADAVIAFNREIHNRCDDSVAFVSLGKTQLIRRSRGYVPAQITLDFDVDGIIATGAELKNTFCLGKNNKAIISQHIGDLKNHETLEFFSESAGRFRKMFRCDPKFIVSDLHPDYLSTQFARESGWKHLQVQHHHAHIASVMAEHGISEKVIGVSFDGVGLGTDGNIWGGEFMVCDYQSFERVSHFEYVPMPGGDKASVEPWRMGVSYLYKYYGKDFLKLKIPFVKNLDRNKTELLLKGIDAGINAPLTSSVGRLFDAVAAICGICHYQDYEAQAAMQLEAILRKDKVRYHDYSYSISAKNVISFDGTIDAIIEGLKEKVPVETISFRFHYMLVMAIYSIVSEVRKKYKLNTVVLSGGCFQNRYLLETTMRILSKEKFHVLIPEKVPANDGGISLGQLAIAAHLIKEE
jgi:hydrogenase maturation protein HypF